MKGTIALDIDGTITDGSHMIPDDVALYFETLHREGWQFILVTGRIFSFAMMTLAKLNFPFLLAVQNGADLLQMPERKHLKRSYFKKDIVDAIDELYTQEKEDFIVYGGYEKGDLCYYRPKRFSPPMLDYLSHLQNLCDVPWKKLETFDEMGQSIFPLVKCFGTKKGCEGFEKKIQMLQELETSVIKDPYSGDLYLVLVSHKEANKGCAVNHFMKTYDLPRPLITGGDDNNDIPLLKVGDIRIAMENAPEALQNLAHIIAPPSSRSGIIQGLSEAIEKLL